ncbi:MAG: outer membrane protein OmpK [Campylobacterota bacterium]|nr:outer membrane protein OmpK [Campylobacterota bacterium]
MKLKKSINPLIYILLLCPVLTADTFKPNYHFENVSINYLNWSKGTQSRSAQKDFAYLEVEGGAGWDWGEFYMFFDIENPTKSYNDTSAESMRFAFKPVIDITLLDNLSLHIQDYNLQSKDFYISNIIVGLSYDIKTDFGLWIRPFIGPHYQLSTYYSGFNGYVGGWVFDYMFNILQTDFSISQWHEFEFDRDKEDGYDEHTGTQGALCFWWHPIKEITTGIQYRYASYNLGSTSYQNGSIYSLKYNF